MCSAVFQGFWLLTVGESTTVQVSGRTVCQKHKREHIIRAEFHITDLDLDKKEISISVKYL